MDIKAIEHRLDKLSAGTDVFVERRIDSSISQVLAGQAVDKI